MWIASLTLRENREDHDQFTFISLQRLWCPLLWARLEKAERDWSLAHLAPVVQKVDSAIHRIIHYPADKYKENQLHYPLDRYQSSG